MGEGMSSSDPGSIHAPLPQSLSSSQARKEEVKGKKDRQ